ncbi:MAG: AraC family transcriptional regulator [Sphingomonadales bacterium]|nr:AraC family transcriptional regulator [Sphingomonadales bacterium]MDE2568593.1 AraC family transcriptional regulator [Sphingomonadales bacterium]
MADLVRVAALTGYLETMAGLGVDPRPLLTEQGLSADMFVNPEQLIPARATIRLLERSAQVTGCTTLGLRMAEGRSLANLGATSLLIAHQPTLRQALAVLGEYRARINSTLVLTVEEGKEEAILHESFSLNRPEAARQSTDLALGVLARLCTTALGEVWRPRTVCFSHQPPPAAELSIFSRVFRCRPQFDCEFDGIVIASSDLDRPNAKADDELALHARQLLDTVMSPAERTSAEEVEQLIKLLLPSGRATIQLCAASMGLTVRTLQRQLDAEDEGFSGLLNRTRMQLSAQYLSNPRMRVTDVADMLGYGSIGAFTRWHVQTFGVSPRQWRSMPRRMQN